jgi:hypothetical protein
MSHVATAKNDFIWFERGNERGDDICDLPPPAALARTFESPLPDVVFVRVLPVGKMAQFHRFDDSVNDHRRTQTRSQAEKQHLPSQ